MAFLPSRIRLAARFLTGWIVENLVRFLFWTLLVTSVFGAALGVIAYVLVKDQSTACQVTSVSVVGLGSVLFGGVAGGALAAVRSLEEWVTHLGLGPLASKAVFAETLGVSDKQPSGTTELAKSLQGATVGDAKRRLQSAFTDTFKSRSLDRWLPSTGRWLASRVLNTAGWLATRAAISQFPGSPDDDTPIDLLGLRDAMGRRIDEQAVEIVALRANAFAWGVLGIGSVLVVALVVAVRWGFQLAA